MSSNRRALIPALAAVLALPACGVDPDVGEDIALARDAVVQIQGPSCVTLLAGQSTPAGSVCSSVEGENLKVTYETTNGWLLYGAHLWAGPDLAGVPQTNSGNPKIGNFPYNAGSLAGVSSYSFLVPLSRFGLSSSMTSCAPVTAYVVAHAVVKRTLPDGTVQSETAYGEGPRLVQRGNWATWFSLVLTCSEEERKIATCETAFAYGGSRATCFIDSGVVTTSRWGWFNGPVGPGSYSFDMYAGAGRCDLTKGTRVGTLGMTYDGASANVTYTMAPGFTMDETHLHVGSEPLARKNGEYTVAPGQYGNIHTLTAASTDSFTVSGLSGDVYVVAHAVTCSSQWPQ
jgi:hypothetical protein